MRIQLGHANERIKYLEERLGRKEKRISELLEEKTGLADQLQEKIREVLRLRNAQNGVVLPSDQANGGGVTAGEGSQRHSQPRPERRRPSGFTVRSGDDRRDSTLSEKIDAVPDMDDWLPLRRPSHVKPVILNRAAWVLSAVPEEERTAYKDLIEGGGGNGITTAVAEASPQPLPTTARPLKRRRRHSSPGSPSTRSRSPRRLRGYLGPRPRRKAVCTHCWLTREFCDFYPTCGTCLRDGVRCVRKLCELGERCENWKCPCLHPGEWDERDGELVVEEGRMPRK